MNKEVLKKIITSNNKFVRSEIQLNKRHILDTLPEMKKVVILYGVRRSGKTFILFEEMLKHPEKYSLYIDFEDERLSEFTSNDFETLLAAFHEIYPESIDQIKYFFLDEVQNISGWEKFARRAVERENIKVYAAGSSSKITPSEIDTSLRGREWSVEIFPYTFGEYLTEKNIKPGNVYLYGKKQSLLINYLNEYMKWGGFPEAVMIDDEFNRSKLLKQYMSAMFFRDIVEKYKISNITLIETLMEKIYSSYSCKLSLNAFYKQYKNLFPISKDALFEYYKYLLRSSLALEVKLFTESAYKRNRNPSKVYLVDPGLALHVRSEDNGRLLENLIFLHLRRKNKEIFYYAGNGECDFIVRDDSSISAFQVTYSLNDENRERELSGLLEGCHDLGISSGTIITFDQEDSFTKSGIEIDVIPAYRWLITNNK